MHGVAKKLLVDATASLL